MMRKALVSATFILLFFIATCISATVDTGMFVYPSLSRSLLMECGLLLMSFVTILHCMVHSKNMRMGRFHFFILLWIAYIVVHGLLSSVIEVYRTTYLCVTLLSIIPLSYCLRVGLLTKRAMCLGLLMIAAAHILCILAQWLGLMKSENTLYPLTGCSDNPTVAALYLVGCLPMYSVLGKRYLRWTFLAASLLCITLLRCRTAYMGICIEVAVFVLMNAKARIFLSKHKGLLLSCLAVALAVGSVKLYQMKRDSADGRLLIWRLSATMIAEHPLGHGYGLFSKHYNERQAEYFRTEHGTDTERRNAAFTYMAYNDFLEHGVDGGIIGALFLMGFYAITIRSAAQSPSLMGRAGVGLLLSAFAVMSMTNFVYSTIQPWLLIICTAAIVLSKTNATSPPHKVLSIPVLISLLAFTSFSAVTVCSMTRAQIRLKRIADRMEVGKEVSDAEFAAIGHRVYSSEAFWRIRASNMMHRAEYSKAAQCIGHTMQLTVAPPLCYMMHQCYVEQGCEVVGLPYICKVYYTCPSLLLPKLLLMRYHDNRGELSEALRYADEITSTDYKIKNERSAAIIREAKSFLKARRLQNK